jgi:hypothetical protein
MISHVHDWQYQYCENNYIIKSSLHVQCNPNKIPMIFITDFEKSILKFIAHLEAQKTLNIPGNSEQNEQLWRYHNT